VASLLVSLLVGIGEEPALGDRGGDDGGENDHGEQERELGRVDDPGVEPEEGGDGAEREPGLMSSVEKAA
jgi:hypothetical protein